MIPGLKFKNAIKREFKQKADDLKPPGYLPKNTKVISQNTIVEL